VSKLYRDLTSQGFSVSRNTLFEYLQHLEDAYLVFLLPIQERSLRKQAQNPKKLHVIDPGIISGFQADPSRNIGHKLETAVFLQTRRRRKDLFYYTNGGEIDLCDENGTLFVNTCWSLVDQETMQREHKSMTLGFKRWPEAEGRLLYHEFSPQLLSQVPENYAAWRYLAGI